MDMLNDYFQRAECFVKQYGKYYNKSENRTSEPTVRKTKYKKPFFRE